MRLAAIYSSSGLQQDFIWEGGGGGGGLGVGGDRLMIHNIIVI